MRSPFAKVYACENVHTALRQLFWCSWHLLCLSPEKKTIFLHKNISFVAMLYARAFCGSASRPWLCSYLVSVVLDIFCLLFTVNLCLASLVLVIKSVSPKVFWIANVVN
jgi:hypothetical protein